MSDKHTANSVPPVNDDTRKKKPGFLKIIQTVLAGALGVQSNRRREEDFSSNSPLPYIVAGIIFVLGFVVTIALVVQWVIHAYGNQG
ncbi:DUF2970 domain-containing protein [Marinobacter sp. V034]|uniref:DUF2970 domain-containing protein n=1 Tax=Marinobacter sp. V034 TaxID=3459610 RepID=UPI0040445F77